MKSITVISLRDLLADMDPIFPFLFCHCLVPREKFTEMQMENLGKKKIQHIYSCNETWSFEICLHIVLISNVK